MQAENHTSMSAQAGEMSSRNPPDIHRQGSVLSRVSDYDVLDVIHDDPDDDGTSKATGGWLQGVRGWLAQLFLD